MAADVYTDGILKAEIRQVDGSVSQVLFPDRGLVFQPLKDTRVDVVRIGGAMKPQTIEQIDTPNHDNLSTIPLARVRLMQEGLEITQPYGNGSVYLPVRAEKLELGPEIPVWAMAQDARIEVKLSNHKPILADYYPTRFLEFTGTNNHLTFDAQELDGRKGVAIQLNPSAQLHIDLRNADALLKMKKLNIANFIYLDVEDAKQDGATVQLKWTKTAEGKYELAITPRDAGKFEPMSLTIALDSTNPKVRERFELALAMHLYVAGENRAIIGGDDGVRQMYPQFDSAKRDIPDSRTR